MLSLPFPVVFPPSRRVHTKKNLAATFDAGLHFLPMAFQVRAARVQLDDAFCMLVRIEEVSLLFVLSELSRVVSSHPTILLVTYLDCVDHG